MSDAQLGPQLIVELQRLLWQVDIDLTALALDFVTVFCRLRRRGVSLYGAGPDAAVGVLQGDAPPAEAEYELFAPAGAVFDAEQECHGIGLWEVLIGTWGVDCLFAESKITKIIE